MKDIEKIIAENRMLFDDSEPANGHFERFEARLDKEFTKKKKIKFNLIWQSAAAVAFIFLAINQAILLFGPKNETSQASISLASVAPEYGEMENYYLTAINTGLSNWESLQKDGVLSDEEQKLLNEELHEFEVTFKNLQAELKANPDDERVINAMVEFYQSKLNVITLILQNIREVKQIKNKEHESQI